MSIRVSVAFVRITAVVLFIAAAAIGFAGSYAHRVVAMQLQEQHITMPGAPAIDSGLDSGLLSQADAAALHPFAGQLMSNGAQAYAYADHYIAPNMFAAAKALGVPEDKASYTGLGLLISERFQQVQDDLRAIPANSELTDEQILAQAYREVADSATQLDSARQVAKLTQLRNETFLWGNTMRGLLLSAYGWWLVGSIAQVVAIFLAIISLAAAVIGFRPRPEADRSGPVLPTTA